MSQLIERAQYLLSAHNARQLPDDGGYEVAPFDLTELVGLDMSTVSNHLAVLRAVGLVVDERRGTQVFYSLRNPCVMNMFCCLDEFRANRPR